MDRVREKREERENPGRNRQGRGPGGRVELHVREFLLVSVLAAFVCLAGCKAAEDKDEGYKILIDDFAEVMLAQDQDSKIYDQALEAVARYLETLSREDLDGAREAVDGAIGQMNEELKGITPYETRDEIEDILKKYEMDPEEYKVNADMRSVRLSDYVSKLDNLKKKLELAEPEGNQAAADSAGPGGGEAEEGEGAAAAGVAGNSGVQAELREILNFWVSYYTRYQGYMRTYSYYSINYWFCQWDQEKTAYVAEQLLDRLESFKTEDAVWEQDREAVERKMDLCLDGVEELGRELETYIGAMQAEVYEER